MCACSSSGLRSVSAHIGPCLQVYTSFFRDILGNGSFPSERGFRTTVFRAILAQGLTRPLGCGMIAPMSAQDQQETVALEPLTPEQDAFALAIIEYNGNLRAAYLAAFGETASSPLANARTLSAHPSVVARVRELLFAAEDQDLISRSAHLAELAEIRDMAKTMGAPKVALEAERSRGEVVGFYKNKADDSMTELERTLAKDAAALSKFVANTLGQLADNLPV